MKMLRSVSLRLTIIGLLACIATAQNGCPVVDPDSFGICPEDCSIDSDCSNGQLCCSNGCGHVCMEPVPTDPCAGVACAAPECDQSAGLVTPDGECCPVCACATPNGDMVAAGTSFMDDCNTCVCSDNGLAGCTRIACPPTTPPPNTSSTTQPPTPPPPACLVAGQVHSECASVCNITCANMNTPQVCPLVCVVNGCECPAGTVINEETNSCVPPTDCPGTATTSSTTQPTTSPPAACLVAGQVHMQCASPCDLTCLNMNSPPPCPAICVINGCQCPHGTVIDDLTNSCIPPSECPPGTATTPTTTGRTSPPPSGCQLSDGTSVNVGDTYMDQCNTCTCLEGGLGACTRKGCLGCTLSNGGWVEVGSTYMDDCNTCTCSGNEVAACTEIACNPNTGVGAKTCPTVQSSNKAVSDCANECSSDDDCQYDRICCSNECGGRTCSDSVEMCQLIQCDWPTCPKNAQPVTSPFSCCPYCPSSSNTVTGDGDGGSGLTSVASLLIIIMCGVVSLVF
ncbi:kielin/chordin-like protein [Dysidea avara]|uniref:kielin/chordin-like protein n=1 Tax=Dysidea avara TaxID=196820 RepID=UPI003325DA62